MALGNLGFSFGPTESILSAEVALPFIELDGQLDPTNPNRLTRTGQDGFASASLDIDALVSTLIPSVPPLTLGAELDFVVGSISAEATLIDVDFNPTLNLDQVTSLDAQGLLIDFDFGRNVNVGVRDADGSPRHTRSPLETETTIAIQPS